MTRMSRALGGGTRRARLSVLVTGMLACLVLAGSPAANAGDPAVPSSVDGAGPNEGDRLVVRLTRPLSDGAQSDLAASVGGERVSEVRPGVFTLEVAEGRRDEALERLADKAEVVEAEPDVRFHVAGLPPNEPCFAGCDLSFGNGTEPQHFSQNEMIRLGAVDAWGVTLGNPDVLVAVIDTDIDATQPDLTGKVIVGQDFSGDPNPDPSGHGTAVAGIIAAQPDNGIGIAGLGWSTRVLSVRVLDSQGAGLATDIAKGIRYAADYSNGTAKVRVINLSLQQDARDADQVSSELASAIGYAQSKGVLIVAAAGNQSRTAPSYPAHFPGVLGVTAVDDADVTASFSNRGPWVDLAAPGVGVLTLAAGCNCWAVPDGTSFAAPFVSAAAALVMAANPTLTADEVAERLEATADQVGATGTDFSAGRLNVGAALKFQPPPDPGTGTLPAGGPNPGSNVTNPAPTAVEPDPAPGPGRPGSETPVTKSRPGPGYWLVGEDGGVFNFGSTQFLGSTGALRLNRPIAGVASTPDGDGYWLVASDGGIFAFGGARFFGSTGALRLNQPIVGMAPTPSGRGYWLVASDGGIFAFGDAKFFGSTGAIRLNQAIVGMAPTPTGTGYWLVASDGGIFNFGDADFFGSAAGVAKGDVIGIAPTATGNGYWIVGSDGRVYPFGAAARLGSPARGTLNSPIVGVAVR